MQSPIRAFALVLALGSGAAAQEVTSETKPTDGARWNQWRGPDRSGAYRGEAWPRRLTKANLEQIWRLELGPSYSGPVVTADHVFTTETVDRKWEQVRALDRNTGEEVWQQRWKGSMQVPFFAKKNGSWIRSTPALDGDSIFVAGMRDMLVCLDAKTGDFRWRVDFMKRFNSPLPNFGCVSSPLVRGDFVYVQAGGGFVKLSKQTGETVWRAVGDGGGMYGSAFSSPIFAKLGGREQLLVQTRSKLVGVEDSDGSELWSVPVKSFRGMNILTPMPYANGVFTSAYGGRGHFFEVAKSEGGEDEEFSVEEKWTSRAQAYMTSPVVIDGHAYLYLRSKRFTCVDLASGERKWVSAPLGDTYWSLIAQNDRILALTDGGELCLIAANPDKFEVVDRIAVSDDDTWAHLAVDGDQVFVRERRALAAYRWSR